MTKPYQGSMPPAQQQEVIRLYVDERLPIEKIAHLVGWSPPTVHRVLLGHGVECRPQGAPRKFDEATEQEIVGLYPSMSMAKIAKRYGCNPGAIKNIMKRHEVELLSLSDIRRRYTLNQAVFDTLTDEAMYWLGFIFADGCVSKPKGDSMVLSVHLKSSDVGHIEKLQSFLGTDRPIAGNTQSMHGRRSYKVVGIAVSSNRICQRILDLGRYSEIDSRLAASRDFWRGVVDGDGYLGAELLKSGSVTGHVKLAGRVEHIQGLLDHLKAVGIHTKATARPMSHANAFEVDLSGNQLAGKVARHLYAESDVWLTRKRAIALELIDRAERYKARRSSRSKKEAAV